MRPATRTDSRLGSPSTSPPPQFWNVNVPLSEQTPECPAFLRYALENKKDQEILSTLDAEYERQSWEEVQSIVRENRIDLFKRVPSDLRLYREYCHMLKKEYGSVMKFVLQERLGWAEDEMGRSQEGDFANEENYKILHNDWPYGIDRRIVHLVVWAKFELPTDPVSAIGDMHPHTRKLIEQFVDDKFGTYVGEEDVVWFKNWTSLKSIHAVEHFHVMLFNPDPQFVRQITRGDVPLYQKVTQSGETLC